MNKTCLSSFASLAKSGLSNKSYKQLSNIQIDLNSYIQSRKFSSLSRDLKYISKSITSHLNTQQTAQYNRQLSNITHNLARSIHTDRNSIFHSHTSTIKPKSLHTQQKRTFFPGDGRGGRGPRRGRGGMGGFENFGGFGGSMGGGRGPTGPSGINAGMFLDLASLITQTSKSRIIGGIVMAFISFSALVTICGGTLNLILLSFIVPFIRKTIAKTLVSQRKPRAALAVETMMKSEIHTSPLCKMVYYALPFNWWSHAMNFMKPAFSHTTRRMELYSNVVDKLMRDKRLIEMTGDKFVIESLPNEDLLSMIDGIEGDIRYDSFLIIPVTDGVSQSSSDRYDVSTAFEPAMGYVYVYYIRGSSPKGPISIDILSQFDDNDNEEYQAVKVVYKPTDPGASPLSLFIKNRLDWDLLEDENSEEYHHKQDEIDRLNEERHGKGPKVVDINEVGGRVMEAEFEEIPKKKYF